MHNTVNPYKGIVAPDVEVSHIQHESEDRVRGWTHSPFHNRTHPYILPLIL